jgi:hypothetical protein
MGSRQPSPIALSRWPRGASENSETHDHRASKFINVLTTILTSRAAGVANDRGLARSDRRAPTVLSTAWNAEGQPLGGDQAGAVVASGWAVPVTRMVTSRICDSGITVEAARLDA